MKRRFCIVSILMLVIFVQMACGKKGPPFLTEKDLGLRVEDLTSEWKDGAFHLQGKIAGPQDAMDNIRGCCVRYACYPVDNPPCEDCPIDYRELKAIEGPVTVEGRFSCKVSERDENGIHFFKVRLLGLKGETGPYSNRARLVIGD